ncbi:MAG: PHP domain-containing protein, partial [Thermoleophilaceae bacterium]
SAGFLAGLNRGKPTVDLNVIARHAAGIIALTGCLASRFCQRLVADREDDARAHADDLLEVFGPQDV